MIKIKNGRNTIAVPKSAYQALYAPAGWTPVKQKNAENTAEPAAENTESSLEEQIASLVTIEDMQQFAADHNVSLEGMTTRKEMRAAIRKALM